MGWCTATSIQPVWLIFLIMLARVSQAQTVLDVLTNLFNQQGAPAVAEGAANIYRLWAEQVPATNQTLQACTNTKVLLNEGGFPKNWAKLTAQEQAAHPINLVMLQLAAAAYLPPQTFVSCFQAMGVVASSFNAIENTVDEYNTVRTALVLRASNQRIFVVFKGSDIRDVTINLACRHEKPPDLTFGVPGHDIRLHRGFWRGWQVLEPDVVSIVQAYLKQVPSGEVYIVGHSLGAAVASIAALRLNAVLGKSNGRVAGVWLIASPRPGNSVFASTYNRFLLNRTLRFSNYQDFAVRVPEKTQRCSIGGASLTADTAQFTFAHVGQSLLMCPDYKTGLVQWWLKPEGSENIDCGTRGDPVDASGTTHQIGSYFDAWRRAYLNIKGDNLAYDPRVQAVLCQACTHKAGNLLEQLGVPARPGGPVTCFIDAGCSMQKAFDAATAVGRSYTMQWSPAIAKCNGFICSSS